MKPLLTLIRAILIGVLAAAVLVNCWLIASRVLLHEDLPKLFGYSEAIVLSGSMEPTFSTGDLLIFKEQQSYEVGDVVIFDSNGMFVTHRIVRAENGAFVTKGDANNTNDAGTLAPTSIEGSLVLTIPGVGNVLTFLKTPLGLLLLVAACLALIEVPRLLDKKKEARAS